MQPMDWYYLWTSMILFLIVSSAIALIVVTIIFYNKAKQTERELNKLLKEKEQKEEE